MSSEASLIAKKLGNYLEIQNPAATEEATDLTHMSIWKTILCVGLMMIVVNLTKISLTLTRWVKKIEKK